MKHLIPVIMAVTLANSAILAADVGVARVDITPSVPIRLHGYGSRSTESQGTDHKLEAQAIAFGSNAEMPLVLITVDNLGIPTPVVEEIASRLKAKANIDRARFAVAASHTHSAPILKGLAPNIFGKAIIPEQQEKIDTYTRELTDKLESVALEAIKNRAPAEIRFGRGSAGFAANRRTAGGPVDHDVPVMWATDATGKIKVILAMYACHCTSIDPSINKFDGDWAGYARDGIEAAFSDATAMIAIGCGADSNPKPRGRTEDARTHGKTLAEEVRRIVEKGAKVSECKTIEAKIERIRIPLDTLPTREELEALVKKGGAPGYNASTQIARLDRGEPIQDAIDYPVQCWAIDDDQAMIFLAGEVVVDYSLAIRKKYDRMKLWVVAYANDVPGYIPSERILREGGYEGGDAMAYYGLATKIKTGVEALILEAVARVVPPRFESKPADAPKPKSPNASLKTIRVHDGLKVELVASEPLVVDPVAIDWGTDGSLWVCEMRDYPLGMDGKFSPGGQIKRLRDRDGDGKYDEATVFLDGLPFPTGVMAWRKGVLICAAPEIIYAEDTDGDGKADVRKTLYRGFATENYQARVNGLSYGLDNWVYGANGLIGGTIRGEASGKTIDIGGRDFRINPDSGEMEPASGLTQQGRVRDDWGNQFGGNNSILIQHYPMPDHYAKRNAYVATPAPAILVPRDADHSRLYPDGITRDRFNEPNLANRVTSACSPCIYRDRWLGDAFSGNAFICEPVHNLVHREVLSADGATFAGHRAPDEAKSEFLSSSDPMFRPVQVRTGPDGALYIVDMYRFVIEHPRWIRPEVLASLDVRAGDQQGRIYRVVPEGKTLRAVPNLDDLATPQLAAAIDSPNGTTRDNVQRLLVHRKDLRAVPVLARISRSSKEPAARVQALATLDGLGSLSKNLVLEVLKDKHPGVRAEAARLAEPRLADAPEIGTALAALAEDPSIAVRFQAALSLGEWNDPRAGAALGKMAVANASDPLIVAAIHSSAGRVPGEILAEVLGAKLDSEHAAAIVGPLVATASATGDVDAIAKKLAGSNVEASAWRLSALADLMDAASRRGRTDLAEQLGLVLISARAVATNKESRIEERVAAARLLGRDPKTMADDLVALEEMLDPQAAVEIQRAAVGALARLGNASSAERLVKRWKGLGPDLRMIALEAILGRREGAITLLDASERGEIAPGEIVAAHRQQLLSHKDESIRKRAAKLWASSPRAEVVASYREVPTSDASADRGLLVFGKVCASCHRMGGQGTLIGPDLAALTDRSASALATAVFDPNREVDARYLVYTAELKDGRVLSGMMASETGNAVTLKRQGGESDVILRADLEAMQGSGKSLMPEGLERDLTTNEFADLVAFLGREAARPKVVAGNAPKRMTPIADGTLRLDASSAEIFGDTLTFESQFANLGYWQSPNDRAVWLMAVPKAGRYKIMIVGACAEDSSGNRLVVRVGDQAIKAQVLGTGPDWSKYQEMTIGEVDLPQGEIRLEVRPEGEVRSALLDLKAVVLTSAKPSPR